MSVAPIEAIVFDFDGLILDTEGPVFRAWQEAFVDHGAELTLDEWVIQIGAVDVVDPEALLRARAQRPLDPDAMHARRRARRDELLAHEAVLPGVEDWLDEATALGLELAIASSSPFDWVHEHLDRLQLRDRFSVIACYDGRGRAKPAPDLYLAACAALNVAPAHAVAVEDSPNGVTAANAAGLHSVAVPHALTAQLDLSHADLIVESLAHVSLRDVISNLRP
ncbi:MAG TPA: HAD-IA family hydrolase [Acidimicrobiia bacterium]|nr:HAD-IA family hydrolase [Acidimicrobiia bacterium]